MGDASDVDVFPSYCRLPLLDVVSDQAQPLDPKLASLFQTWIQIKLECPVCRRAVPEMEDGLDDDL